ncbi:MAG: hypothetical protein U0174_25605 [Polyangiaceae bacterium]
MRLPFLAVASVGLSVIALSVVACVEADVGGVRPDAGADAGASTDTGAPLSDSGGLDGSLTDGAVITDGDVLFLDGSAIEATNEFITAWPDAKGRAKFKPTGGSAPAVVAFGASKTRCASFAVGTSSLLDPTTSAIQLGDEYSVTLKLVRGAEADQRDDGIAPFGKVKLYAGEDHMRNYNGFAFLSDYQDPGAGERSRRFAGRFNYVLGASAKDIVEPTARTEADQRFVVTFKRRGADAVLLVRAPNEVTGVTRATGFGTIVEPEAAITLGSTRTDNDDATKFDGLLCTVIVHVGPETDEALEARIEKLKWQ